MAFVDEITIQVKAGKGGDGVVRWRHEKFREFSGPSGGDGGKGGDVYAVGVRDILRLSKYQSNPRFEAEPGGDGQKSSMHGKNGKDLEIMLPVGSVLTNTETGEVIEILKEDQRTLLVKGGIGGLGNEHFKSSRNTTPRECTPGKPGQQANYQVELRLFAEAGFVGFPNAGKTSLLNVLTNAGGKVGNYQFTTLDPNLGAFYGFILADIPGLIEGASEGKGLGDKFLRHITRTKLIFHCISLERDDLVRDYRAIRSELKAYSEDLENKPEIIILTKTDVLPEADDLKSKQKNLARETGRRVLSVSIIDEEAVEHLKEEILKILKESEDSATMSV